MELIDYVKKYGRTLTKLGSFLMPEWEKRFLLDSNAINENGDIKTKLCGTVYKKNNWVITFYGNQEEIDSKFREFKNEMHGDLELFYVDSPINYVNAQKKIVQFKEQYSDDKARGIEDLNFDEIIKSM